MLKQRNHLAFSLPLSALFYCLLFVDCSICKADEFEFGFAKANITPSQPVRLSGYAVRKTPFEGIDEQIFVRAMAMRSNDSPDLNVIVSIETIGLPAQVTNQIFTRVRKLGITRDRLAVCMTHCHTAPHIAGGLDNLFAPQLRAEEKEATQIYTDLLIDKTVEAIENAAANLKPGRLFSRQGEVTFARNRRVLTDGLWSGFGENSNGPVDHSLPVLRITDGDGKKTVGILFNYACHCTTFGGKYNRVNGDWAGYAAKQLEQANPEALALCTIGCGADANPERDSPQALELAKAQGKQISDEITRMIGFDRWREIASPPNSTFGYAGLPVDRPGREQLKKSMEDPNLHTRQHAQVMTQTMNRMGRLPETIPMPIQVWRFDDELAMVFLSGEVVVDYATRIKKEIQNQSGLDDQQIWVSAYSNDIFGYVTSERMRNEGGYEVDFSMIYYLIPGRWSAGTEEVVINRVNELFSGKKVAKPLSVEESLQTFSLPDGLNIEVVVAEPLVEDPINFAIDAKGRLWVVEMGDYPKGESGELGVHADNKEREPWDGEPGGKIKLIVDSDGDGSYDKSTVFMDKLVFPTGVFPWRDGVLISGAPDIIFAKDTDGDGLADFQETLYTGFEEANPQHRVNGFTYGLDGWLYLSGGTNNKQIKCVKTGETVRLSGRDVRIHPQSGRAEAVSGDSQYGRCQDSVGNWYGNTNSEPLFQLVIEDRFISRNPHVKSPSSKRYLTDPILNPLVFPTSRTLDRYNDLHTSNRFTSACAPHVLRDSTLGNSLESSALICEPVHNLISRVQLQTDGIAVTASRFPSEANKEVIASTDNWFRPVRLMTGPQGGLWICDMYRHVLEHPEWIPEAWQASLDLYAGSDKGRIFRIARDGESPKTSIDFTTLSVEELAKKLGSRNGWQRDIAQQLLTEMFDLAGNEKDNKSLTINQRESILSTIEQIVHNKQLNLPARIQSVWAYSILSNKPFSNHSQLLRVADPNLAANMIRAFDLDVKTILAFLNSNSPNRHHSKVLFEIALAAYAFEDDDKTKTLRALLPPSADNKWIRAAVLSSSASIADALLVQVLKTLPPSEGRSQLVTGLTDSMLAESFDEGLVKISQLSQPESNDFETWQLEIVASCLEKLRTKKRTFRQLDAKVQGIKDVAETYDLAIAESLKVVEQISPNNAVDENPQRRQLASIRILASADSNNMGAARKCLTALLGPQNDQELQTAAVESLLEMKASGQLVAVIPNSTPVLQRTIQTKILSRQEWALELIEGIDKKTISPNHLMSSTVQALLNHPGKNVRDAAKRVLSLQTSSVDRKTLVNKYVSSLSKTKSIVAGKALFEQHCASCHRHGNIGQAIGPNLSLLAEKNDEYLVKSIFDPNASVEWKYKSYNVVTVEGRVYSGMIQEESATSLTLANADGKSETILLSDIEEMKNSSKSFMPEGLEKNISPEQISDLIGFIRSQK